MVPEHIIRANIELMQPGISVECGVWKGGMMAEMMKVSDLVIGYDSFEGLPEPTDIDGIDAIRYAANKNSPEYYDNCKAEYDEVNEYLSGVGSNFKLVKGWYSPELFEDCPEISVLRLDCDWYTSVRICLENIFPKLKDGGIVIVDDYYAYDGCALAVNEFVKHRRIKQHKGVCYFIK